MTIPTRITPDTEVRSGNVGRFRPAPEIWDDGTTLEEFEAATTVTRPVSWFGTREAWALAGWLWRDGARWAAVKMALWALLPFLRRWEP